MGSRIDDLISAGPSSTTPSVSAMAHGGPRNGPARNELPSDAELDRFLHELAVDLKEIDRKRHMNNFLAAAAGTLRSHLQAGLWAFQGFWPLNITVKSGVSPKIVVKCHDPREWHLADDGDDVPFNIGERMHQFLLQESIGWNFRL